MHTERLPGVIPLGGLTYHEYGAAVILPAVLAFKLAFDYVAAWINPAHATGAIFWILFLIGPAYWGLHYLTHLAVEVSPEFVRFPRRVQFLISNDALPRADLESLDLRPLRFGLGGLRRAILFTIGALLALGVLAALRSFGLMFQHWCIAGAVAAFYHAARPAVHRLSQATHVLRLTLPPDPFVPLSRMLVLGPLPQLNQIVAIRYTRAESGQAVPGLALGVGESERVSDAEASALPAWLREADLSEFDPQALVPRFEHLKPSPAPTPEPLDLAAVAAKVRSWVVAYSCLAAFMGGAVLGSALALWFVVIASLLGLGRSWMHFWWAWGPILGAAGGLALVYRRRRRQGRLFSDEELRLCENLRAAFRPRPSAATADVQRDGPGEQGR